MQKKLLGLAVAGALAAPGTRTGAGGGVRLHQHVGRQLQVLGARITADSAAWAPCPSGTSLARLELRHPRPGKPRHGPDRLVPDRAERADGALERRQHHARVAQLRGRRAGRLGNVVHRPVDHAVGGPGRAVGHRHRRWLGPITSIIGRRETTGTAPNSELRQRSAVSPARRVLCDTVEAAGGVGHAFWRRISNSIFYQSPVFAGVQVKLTYQTNEEKATAPRRTGDTIADPSMWSGSVQWADGPGCASARRTMRRSTSPPTA